MKLLYDYRIFSLQYYGGISRYFYELVKEILELKKQEIEILLFEGLYVNKFDFKEIKSDLKNYYGFRHPYIYKTKHFFIFLNEILFKIYLLRNKKSFKDSEVIYHPTYYSPKIRKIAENSKIIITVFDMIAEKFPEYFPNSRKVLHDKKESIESADSIICISESTKNDLLNFYNIDEKKIHVVYLASGLSNNYSQCAEVLKQNKIHDDKRDFILYVGERYEYKNFIFLLKTYFEEKLYIDFDLVCFGGKTFNNYEQKYIDNNKLNKNVKFISGNDSDLINLYKNARCLVYPSKYEGFGIPIIEAMSLCCPVIASNSSSIPEVTGNAALLFNPLDRNDLLNNLSSILYDNRLRQKLIIEGMQQSKKFSWKKTAIETLDIYKNLF
jgi:glycosyltransferase involved in cell wall biosynthesis